MLNSLSLQPTSSTSSVLSELLRGVSCVMTGLGIRSPMPKDSHVTWQCIGVYKLQGENRSVNIIAVLISVTVSEHVSSIT